MTDTTNFRSKEIDSLAERVIPRDYFQFTVETARDRFFNDTRMLDIKQIVHNRFRTNPASMVDHMLGILKLSGREALLDLGCGNGFVLEHIRPYMAEGEIVGLDVSPAVLKAAAERLRGVVTKCRWILGSADDLGMLQSETFDRVMANYMMHYVPDLDRCLSEVARVMRRDGTFMLTTDRPDSMVEMYDVHFSALRSMGAPEYLFKATPKGRISLDNGHEKLSRHFPNVEIVSWQDQLRFSESDPFIEFYRVGHNYCCAASEPDANLTPAFFSELESRVRRSVDVAIAERGYFAVTKFTGAFVAGL